MKHTHTHTHSTHLLCTRYSIICFKLFGRNRKVQIVQSHSLYYVIQQKKVPPLIPRDPNQPTRPSRSHFHEFYYTLNFIKLQKKRFHLVFSRDVLSYTYIAYTLMYIYVLYCIYIQCRCKRHLKQNNSKILFVKYIQSSDI